MAVDGAEHLPAVGFEALAGVIGEPSANVAVDGDLIVIVEDDELAEAQGAGQRTGFVGDPLHQTAIADRHVGVMIDDVESLAVELSAEHALGERHPDPVGETLTERSGGGLDSGG